MSNSNFDPGVFGRSLIGHEPKRELKIRFEFHTFLHQPLPTTMATKDDQEDLFPVIGRVAEQADNIPADSEKPTTTIEGEEEERVVTEIESLCMKCREQVSR